MADALPRHPKLSSHQAALRVLDRLRSADHVAYFAGGCVRDALLGLKPKDYDIATSARPEEVLRLYPRARSVGEAFGVILVQLSGHMIEVATFRREWGYSDGRHPDHVVFSDAESDAQRRDFSLNGLFADPYAPPAADQPRCVLGQVIDYVGGVADLRRGEIRAIGCPMARFAEDYLRMLRAVRFAARFDFSLDPVTAQAIEKTAPRLNEISRERIGLELKTMLLGPRPALAAGLLQILRLDGPTLQEAPRIGPLPVLEAFAPKLPTLLAADRFPAALLAWMLDRHLPVPEENPSSRLSEQLDHFARSVAPDRIEAWRQALMLSNDERNHLRAASGVLSRLPNWPELEKATRKRLLAARGSETARALLAALPGAEGLMWAERIAEDAVPLTREGLSPAPLLTGGDLIGKLDLRPGPLFGRLLAAAYDAQLEGTITHPAQAVEWARTWLKSGGAASATDAAAI